MNCDALVGDIFQNAVVGGGRAADIVLATLRKARGSI